MIRETRYREATVAFVAAMRWMCVGCPAIKFVEVTTPTSTDLTVYPKPCEVGAMVGRRGATIRSLAKAFDVASASCDRVAGTLRMVNPLQRAPVARTDEVNELFTPDVCGGVLSLLASVMFDGATVAVASGPSAGKLRRFVATLHHRESEAESVAANFAHLEIITNAICKTNGAVILLNQRADA
jgi:hypothetical protein